MSLFQDNEYKEFNDKIDSIKHSLKKQEYLKLQNMLLNAYNRERNNETEMKTQILNSLNKNIGKHLINIENTEKGNNSNNKIQQVINPYYEKHIRRRRTMKKNLLPIIEEANSRSNTKTRSKSRGGRNTRKNMKKTR
jgi:vacuolar-type H+-ATPase subunit E/Vma4